MSLSRVLLVLVLVFAGCMALLVKAGSVQIIHYLDGRIDNQITKWADSK